jgi:hypothetical protein
MANEERKGRTDLSRRSKDVSSQTKPPHAPPRDDFERWEIKFDAALERPGTLKAWRTLIQKQKHRCDPRSLKSALYDAAVYLDTAQESPREVGAYLQEREAALNQLAKLKQMVRELMAHKLGTEGVVDQLLLLYGVKKKDVRFVKDFPALLERFESILKIIKETTAERHALRAMLTAMGEALVHIYVKETTGRLLTEEVAVLLQAGATSYGLDHGPRYSAAAVSRRYRRFRTRASHTDDVIRELVRQFGSGNFGVRLDRFVEAGMVLDMMMGRFYEDQRGYLDKLR